MSKGKTNEFTFVGTLFIQKAKMNDMGEKLTIFFNKRVVLTHILSKIHFFNSKHRNEYFAKKKRKKESAKSGQCLKVGQIKMSRPGSRGLALNHSRRMALLYLGQRILL
jgi:hypothetical protein